MGIEFLDRYSTDVAARAYDWICAAPAVGREKWADRDYEPPQDRSPPLEP